MSCQRKKPLIQFARRTPLFCGLKEECVFVCSASAREWGEEKKGIFLKYAQRCKRFKANISTGLDTSLLFFGDTLISLLCPVVWKKQTPHCPLVVLNGTWDLFGLELLSVNVYPEKIYIFKNEIELRVYLLDCSWVQLQRSEIVLNWNSSAGRINGSI